MKSQGHTVVLLLLLVGTVRSQTTDDLPNTSSEVEDATSAPDVDGPATTTGHPECGPNKEWRTCATCNRTCADPRPICTDECKPAQCQCIDGYVLALNGNCVDEDACPTRDATTEGYVATKEGSAECGEHEEWRKCATCNRTCADPRPVCTEECKPAQCQCIEGYVLALDGTCVDEDACPASDATTEGYVATKEGSAECGEHEEWRKCATCNRTCADPRPVCTEECKPAQCQCIDGYVLALNGTCIDEDACPASDATTEGYVATKEGSAECGEHEEYRTCASCNRTCANPRPVCTEECKPEQCQCIEGYVLASNGTCIPEDECGKHQCGPNEEFIYCPGCEPTCADPYPTCPKRPCILDENNRGCQCASGYVRNAKGKCVLPADCRQWRCNPPCPEGYKCELKQVWCIRAPCPPRPTCIQTFPWWWVRHWFP